MELTVSPAGTFVARYVRRMLMKRLCSPDHPMLSVEDVLVSMAARRLRGQVVDEPGMVKVCGAVMKRIMALDEDDQVKGELLRSVRSSDIFAELSV